MTNLLQVINKALIDIPFLFYHLLISDISVSIPGLIGLACVCGMGAYKYKYRGGMSTSVFLMQLRVAAQGTVVGALSLGLAYTMANKFLFKTNDSDEK